MHEWSLSLLNLELPDNAYNFPKSVMKFTRRSLLWVKFHVYFFHVLNSWILHKYPLSVLCLSLVLQGLSTKWWMCRLGQWRVRSEWIFKQKFYVASCEIQLKGFWKEENEILMESTFLSDEKFNSVSNDLVRIFILFHYFINWRQKIELRCSDILFFRNMFQTH